METAVDRMGDLAALFEEVARNSPPARGAYADSRARGHGLSQAIATLGNRVFGLLRDRLVEGDTAGALELLDDLDGVWEALGETVTGCRGEFGESAGVAASVLWSWGIERGWSRKSIYRRAETLRGDDGVFLIEPDGEGSFALVTGQDLERARAEFGEDHELLAGLLAEHPGARAALYHKRGRFLVRRPE